MCGVPERVSNRISFLIRGVFLCTTVLSSCNAPEPYPSTPNIVFKDLKYIPAINQDPSGIQSFDTLSLSFDFTDGEGNLGLSSDEKFDPYHDYDIILDSNGKVVTFSSKDIASPLYKYKRTNTGNLVFWNGEPREIYSNNDNRPDFSCENYEILRINQEKNSVVLPEANTNDFDTALFKSDTVLIEKNVFRNNIYVFFEVDSAEIGVFKELDWARLFDDTGCGIDFHARFPEYSPALEGTVTYNMGSLGFRTRLGKGKFRLRFFIIDRSLNISDTIFTPAFRLSDIGPVGL